MKTKYIIVISLLFFSLTSFALSNSSIIQNTSIIDGVFEGHEDYGYNFIITRSEDDSEYTMTFQNVNEDVLGQFDLKSESLMGKKFKITYQIKIKRTKDENGFDEEEEILTITSLVEM
jgi:hypothetical protein